jgi:hypothetical protein
MEMKPHEKSLGCKPLSDAPYQNPSMVLNGQGPGRHPLDDALYLDLDMVLNEIVPYFLFMITSQFTILQHDPLTLKCS